MAGIPHEFTINTTGEVTGENYRGLFKIKQRLSHRDTLQQDQMRRNLLGEKPQEAGPSAVASSLVFAKIWVHVIEAPNWWKDAGNGLDLEDEAPIVAVYDQIQKMEKDLVSKVKKEGEDAATELKPKE